MLKILEQECLRLCADSIKSRMLFRAVACTAKFVLAIYLHGIPFEFSLPISLI